MKVDLAPRLPTGVRSRVVDNGNGLRMHVLEAGYERANAPCLLLLHGFPELAYSWRKVIAPLAAAGYHVVVPDQRAYGGTADGPVHYNDDLAPFRMLNLIHDLVGLLSALGRREVAAVIGHDFGSMVAAVCGVVRPDVFRAVALMSAPFGGIPALPFNAQTGGDVAPPGGVGFPATLHDDLARLDPPRRHYQWYYSTPAADTDMRDCAQGLHAFLRSYYHVKSADWDDNRPHVLPNLQAATLATMPHYYIMPADRNMAQAVAEHAPSDAAAARCEWLTDAELSVYVEAFGRNGFQGPLQWYRCQTSGYNGRELSLFSGRVIDVPSCFISGSSDWGHFQKPGDLERMQNTACTDFRGLHFVDGAGHWVQQEQPVAVVEHLLRFLGGLGA